MCACGELDPSYVCSRCRDTQHDPLYHEAMHDQDDPCEPETVRPPEFEVRDA